jgi:hypothetical protein
VSIYRQRVRLPALGPQEIPPHLFTEPPSSRSKGVGTFDRIGDCVDRAISGPQRNYGCGVAYGVPASIVTRAFEVFRAGRHGSYGRFGPENGVVFTGLGFTHLSVRPCGCGEHSSQFGPSRRRLQLKHAQRCLDNDGNPQPLRQSQQPFVRALVQEHYHPRRLGEMRSPINQQLPQRRPKRLSCRQIVSVSPRRSTSPRVLPTDINEIALPFGRDATCFEMGPQPHLVVLMGGHNLALCCAEGVPIRSLILVQRRWPATAWPAWPGGGTGRNLYVGV